MDLKGEKKGILYRWKGCVGVFWKGYFVKGKGYDIMLFGRFGIF